MYSHQQNNNTTATPTKQQHYSHTHKTTTTLQPRPQNNNTTATPAKQQHYSHAHKTTTLQPRPQNNNTTATPTKQQQYNHAGKHASYWKSVSKSSLGRICIVIAGFIFKWQLPKPPCVNGTVYLFTYLFNFIELISFYSSFYSWIARVTYS